MDDRLDRPGGWTWPQFEEPELSSRLRMTEDEFLELWLGAMTRVPPREFSRSTFEAGTGYPWPRPDGSFVLSEGEGRLLEEIEEPERRRLVASLTDPARGRTPVLAIGSNASPEGLWRKVAHFEHPEDRTLLAIRGRLHDFDVVAAAEVALYGAMPATIVPSPGTRVQAMAVWLTERQLTQLTWAEIPYWLGRLEAVFEFDHHVEGVGEGFDWLLAFVNRFGAFAPHGRPLALAAIPAEGRKLTSMHQLELLGEVSRLVLGDRGSAEDLIRLAFESPAETAPRVTGVVRSNSIEFESDRWTPWPGPGT